MNTQKKIKQVLIAHQSTIPHYRVPFYAAVENLKPKWWEFTVIYDKEEAQKNFYMTSDPEKFNFKIKTLKSYSINVFGRRLIFQTFPFTSFNYDLLIVGQAMNNIAYPLSFIRKIFGKLVVYWGQGRDLYLIRNGILKNLSENIKFFLTKYADGFFAYTPGVKSYLINKGIKSDYIFSLQNTLDINDQRRTYQTLLPNRKMLRRNFSVENCKVLLYVGRFNKEKRVDIIADAFLKLVELDDSYVLIIVGGGDKRLITELINKCGHDRVKLFNSVPENEIGKYFVMSDLFLIPGSVGLNVIQAMCYDLVPVVINTPFQSPEFEYLNNNNAVILGQNSSPEEFAIAIHDLLANDLQINKLKIELWHSIQHLTIENMALNFIGGVNQLLKNKD